VYASGIVMKRARIESSNRQRCVLSGPMDMLLKTDRARARLSRLVMQVSGGSGAIKAALRTSIY
jgi:hypothetical protein